MATSGSINFSVSRDDIIEEALMHLGILPEGGAPTANQLTDDSRTFNIMVKAWIAKGINLWAVQRITLFLENDKISYTAGTDHIAATDNVVRTTLSSAAASGASSIVVTSATGISNGYYIGVELDDGTVQWTTVNGAPSGTTITLTDTLTGAASSGNVIYVYSTKINALQVKTILQAFLRQSDLTDSPLNIVSRQEYYGLGNKTSEGSPAQVYLQPNLTSTLFLVYPEPDDETETIELLVQRTLEDFDAAGDTPDFPQEWYQALCWGLAAELSAKYGKTISERNWFHEKAAMVLEEVEGFDKEHETSIYIQPDFR